jgi:DNA (cytosine-5)-methyltransferase 1
MKSRTDYPGFSTLQQNYLNDASLKNASHITTYCSTVDLYRPKYALLENVVSMAHTRTGLEDQNVLSQLIACLVSMGYQVSQYIMDSWNYGSGQQRSRVFITIAAPGLDPIIQPFHTHSRPLEETSGRSLGTLPNGERFGQREHYPTPFSFITAGTITSDLPDIGNGNVQTCISHPDHRVSNPPSRKDRALLECIPRNPPGCGYKEAYRLGLIPPSLQKPGKEHGKAFQRVKQSGLVPTITTNLSMQDSRNGANLHWSQNRSLTILDARRAQGYMDEEPIIGNLVEQYRIVGNGVDRMVAFANGLALRQALISSAQKHTMSDVAPIQEQEMLVDVDEEEDHFTDAMSDSLGISTFGGPSDIRDTTPAAYGVFTRGVEDLSLRSLHERAMMPARSKRSRNGNSVHLNRNTIERNVEAMRINKRAKVCEAVNKSTPQTDVIKIEASSLLKDYKVPANMRYTRHSGLELTFEPKQWNRKPEREHSVNR